MAAGPGLFLRFFYLLRARGLRVTPEQWLLLIQGLVQGLHGASLMGFYSLARAILCKDESELDEFDQVFAHAFKGAELPVQAIEEEIFRWLERPIAPYEIDPALRQALDQVDVDALREEFERRLREQHERHDGGSHWVGTGGTSPFGHSGYHPGGIRVGGEGRLGSAVKVAALRMFREHRRDLVLDTRQLGVALRKLRRLRREGLPDELDLDGTIDRTAREAGDLSLVFRPPRANNLELLLLMDVGGSMEPHRRLVDLLFSAAHQARHFKRFEHAYFHNCVYDHLYRDARFQDQLPLAELFGRHGRETRVVMVGDAHMYPGELLDRGGSIHWWERNEESGLHSLKRLAGHFRHTAWLNPMTERLWSAPSVTIVRQVFPMYPLTIDGVEALVEELCRGS